MEFDHYDSYKKLAQAFLEDGVLTQSEVVSISSYYTGGCDATCEMLMILMEQDVTIAGIEDASKKFDR